MASTIPNVTIKVNTSGLAPVPPQAGNVPLLLGVAETGTFGLVTYNSIPTISGQQGSNPLTAGPLADKAALDISTGASAVQCWRMFSGSVDTTAYGDGNTPGNGTKLVPNFYGVTAGTGTIDFIGAAGSLTPVILIKESSDTSTNYATFDYSLDGGNSYTGSATAFTGAGTYALGASGVSIFLAVDTETTALFVAGDVYQARGVAKSHASTGAGKVAITGNPMAPSGVQVGNANVWNGVIVQITTSGVGALASFNYSLDGGNTYSAAQLIPAGLIYVIPGTGLTVTFTSAQYESGDTFRSPVTGFQGQLYPYGSTGFGLLQVGVSGSVASAKGAGTFGAGATSTLGKITAAVFTPGVVTGTGKVVFTGAVGAVLPVIKITTPSDGSTTNGDFEYNVTGTFSGSTGIPAPGVPIPLGSSGISATFTGGLTGGFYTTGVWVVGDAFGVALPSPSDSYQPIVEIISTGTAAAGGVQFIFSMDNGLTFSPTQIMSAGGAINLGHGVQLTAQDTGGAGGTPGFQAGDVYSFACLPPQFTTTDVSNVLGLLQGVGVQWGWVHVIGYSNTVSGSATRGYSMTGMFGLLDGTWMPTWFAGDRFGVYAHMESPPDSTQSSIDAALITVAPTLNPAAGGGYVGIGAGDCAVTSPITGFQMTRNAEWAVSARCCSAPVGQDLGDVAAGPLVGVTQLFRNENITPGLDAAGYSTLRTITGVSGFFITNGNVFAPSGSDIYLAQYRRVIDQAAYLAYGALVQYLNASVRVLPGGTIDPRDAKNIQSNCSTAIAAGLSGQVSLILVQVDLTHNILADGTLPVQVSITPLGYSKYITVTIGFTNGALQALVS